MSISVDTNVISSIWLQQSNWDAIGDLLTALQHDTPLVVCAPVFAELSGLPRRTPEDVAHLLTQARIAMDFELGQPVWERAAATYSTYCDRRRKSGGGFPRRLVTDFLIGAHALVRSHRLITADVRFFGETFPGLRVIPIPGTSA